MDLTDGGSGIMLQYEFVEDSTYFEYNRTRYNVIDVLTEVGSLSNPFMAFGYFCSLTFSYNLMMSSIMSSLYSFEAKFDSEVKKDKKDKKKSKKKKTKNTLTEENDPHDDDEEDGSNDLNQQYRELRKMYEKEQERLNTASG